MNKKVNFEQIEDIDKKLSQWNIIYSKCGWKCWCFGLIPYFLSVINIAYFISSGLCNIWACSIIPSAYILFITLIYVKCHTESILAPYCIGNSINISNARKHITNEQLKMIGIESQSDIKYILKRLHRKPTYNYSFVLLTNSISIISGIILSKYTDYLFTSGIPVKLLLVIVIILLCSILFIERLLLRELFFARRERKNILLNIIEDLYFEKRNH